MTRHRGTVLDVISLNENSFLSPPVAWPKLLESISTAIVAYRQALLPEHLESAVDPDFGQTRLLLIAALQTQISTSTLRHRSADLSEISVEIALAEKETQTLPATHPRRIALQKERARLVQILREQSSK